jgi:putative restriction endonuclease
LLIARYFRPSEQIALYEAIGLPIPSPIEIEQNAADQSPVAAQLVGREARFRMRVLAAYDYTCALTGHRLTTISGASIVDAAHIHQFADSRNNDLDNGIALSKTAHWLFDRGLWTISDDYQVQVALDAFEESAPHDSLVLASKNGASILLPNDRHLYPNPLHLDWHRRRRFARDLP